MSRPRRRGRDINGVLLLDKTAGDVQQTMRCKSETDL